MNEHENINIHSISVISIILSTRPQFDLHLRMQNESYMMILR